MRSHETVNAARRRLRRLKAKRDFVGRGDTVTSAAMSR